MTAVGRLDPHYSPPGPPGAEQHEAHGSDLVRSPEHTARWIRSVPHVQIFLEVARSAGVSPHDFVELAAAIHELGAGAVVDAVRAASRARSGAQERARPVQLADHMDDALVIANLGAADWAEAVSAVVARVTQVHPGSCADTLCRELERDPEQAGWLLGGGVAIPHAQCPGLPRPLLAVTNLRTPLALDTPDGIPVSVLFVLLDPPGAADLHLHLLARIANLCSNDGNLGLLRAARDDMSLADAIVALDQSA